MTCKPNFTKLTAGLLKQIKNTELLAQLREVLRGRYGSPRIAGEPQASGISASRPRITKLMQKNGIKSIMQRKYRITTNFGHLYPVNKNLLMRDFSTNGIGKKWVNNITYIRTGESCLYLTAIMDLADRRIVGWSMDSSMSAESFFKTLNTEMVYHTRFETREQGKLEIFDYIEVWYNRKRRRSAFDYNTPDQAGQTIAIEKIEAA